MRRGGLLLAAWTGVIVLLVAPWASFQNHSHWQRVAWIPFLSPPIRVRDIVANVLLYLPWGYLCSRQMRGALRSVWTVAAFAAVLSTVTEFSQLYSHGRFPSVTDLFCNVIGALAGALYARQSSMKYDRCTMT